MSFEGIDISTLNGGALMLIESYGDGGFQISGQNYRGSLLIIDGRVSKWEVQDFDNISQASLSELLQASPELCFLGCGASMLIPRADVRKIFETSNVALDFMATAAACRSYNIAIGEGRKTAAALLVI